MEKHKAPEGYSTITTSFAAYDPEKFIEFIKKVFDAKEKYIMKTPKGNFMHGEFLIGDSVIMIGEATEESGESSNSLYVYVNDVDKVFQKAMNASAESLMPVEDQFYGDRIGGFRDPFGNKWMIASHVRDVSEEEMTIAFKEFDNTTG